MASNYVVSPAALQPITFSTMKVRTVFKIRFKIAFENYSYIKPNQLAKIGSQEDLDALFGGS